MVYNVKLVWHYSCDVIIKPALAQRTSVENRIDILEDIPWCAFRLFLAEYPNIVHKVLSDVCFYSVTYLSVTMHRPLKKK